jgi:hypothetical protein
MKTMYVATFEPDCVVDSVLSTHQLFISGTVVVVDYKTALRLDKITDITTALSNR